jgi:hypothetical protein
MFQGQSLVCLTRSRSLIFPRRSLIRESLPKGCHTRSRIGRSRIVASFNSLELSITLRCTICTTFISNVAAMLVVIPAK